MMPPVNILETGNLLFWSILAARLKIILNAPYVITVRIPAFSDIRLKNKILKGIWRMVTGVSINGETV